MKRASIEWYRFEHNIPAIPSFYGRRTACVTLTQIHLAGPWRIEVEAFHRLGEPSGIFVEDLHLRVRAGDLLIGIRSDVAEHTGNRWPRYSASSSMSPWY